MRKCPLASLALAALVLCTGTAAAQTPKVKITGVRVGFAGREGQPRRAKAGLWAPVSVDLQVGNERLAAGEYALIVEASDSEDNQNLYIERRFLPTLEPRDSPTLLTYACPGTTGSEINVQVRSVPDNRILSQYKTSRPEYDPLPPSLYVTLTLGGPIPSMKRVLARRNANMALVEGIDDAETEENETRRFCHADAIEQMPTNWFGYQAADIVVLATGNEKFISDLNRDNDDQVKARLEALAEWVRRGGHLIVTVGHNHQHANAVLEKLKIINLQIKGQIPNLAGLPGLSSWCRASAPYTLAGAKPGAGSGNLEVANIEPGPGVRVLANAFQAAPGITQNYPVIVRASSGLGQVLVVGLDVDTPPFTSWKGQKDFWESLVRETGAEPPGAAKLNMNPQVNRFGNQVQELSTKLQDGIESFPDVPVISFGWVALFILIYIVIVGPLDYFFLKKVVKRLELTWITFPTVVIVISAVAYYTAYALKGNDLRINKVDVVDIDLQGLRAYGTAWFTLFSPRIQNYTIGIEPNTPTWGKEPPPREGSQGRTTEWAKDRYAPLVGWMGRPETVWGGMGRGGSGGLFRRAYSYAPEASGLEGVPIQVWSMKSFSASYDRVINPADWIEANLSFTKADPNKVGGRIVSHLPVELHDVTLFYAGKGYNLDKLLPEEPVILDTKNVQSGGQGDVSLNKWFSEGYWRPTAQGVPVRPKPGFAPQQAGGVTSPGMVIKSILFHGHQEDGNSSSLNNSVLRSLNQRWRLELNNREEVILYGRAVAPANQPSEGPAEQVGTSVLAPSRLWLGQLPGPSGRPALQGTMSQETYVRVFIPVTRP